MNLDGYLPVLIAIIVLQLGLFWYVKHTAAPDKQDLQELALLKQQLDGIERRVAESMSDMRSEQNALARAARIENQAAADRLAEQLDKRMEKIGESTDKNLLQIRNIVDEKLQATLERRLGESFAQVSNRLEEVHRGLGEMKSLAGNVGDLKKILGNVKNRGIWGEMQLEFLLRDLLTGEQYAKNVEINPGSGEFVEFAVKLPGQKQQQVWLAIDAKFPQEDYQRLLQAREDGVQAEAEICLKQLRKRLKGEAVDINKKYICPPHSTDFAIMYLPTEGLFAEAVNMPGLLDELQRDYRVCVAGPTTLAALLNSLQMGFRTFAIEERTAEVWHLLVDLRQEFGTFAVLLDKTKKKLQEAGGHIEAATVRTRVINKKLVRVGEIEDEREPELAFDENEQNQAD